MNMHYDRSQGKVPRRQALIAGLLAVSYTHLDGYKRQGLTWPASAGESEKPSGGVQWSSFSGHLHR